MFFGEAKTKSTTTVKRGLQELREPKEEKFHKEKWIIFRKEAWQLNLALKNL
jgi:hypothetical protein